MAKVWYQSRVRKSKKVRLGMISHTSRNTPNLTLPSYSCVLLTDTTPLSSPHIHYYYYYIIYSSLW